VAFRKAKAEEHAAKLRGGEGVYGTRPVQSGDFGLISSGLEATGAISGARSSDISPGTSSGSPEKIGALGAPGPPSRDAYAGLPAEEAARLKRLAFRKFKQEEHAARVQAELELQQQVGSSSPSPQHQPQAQHRQQEPWERRDSVRADQATAAAAKTESVAQCLVEFPELLSRVDRELAPWHAEGISRAMLDRLWRCDGGASTMRRFAGLYVLLQYLQSQLSELSKLS